MLKYSIKYYGTDGPPYSRHKARENVRKQIAIGFGFISDWFKSLSAECKTKASANYFLLSSENFSKQYCKINFT